MLIYYNYIQSPSDIVKKSLKCLRVIRNRKEKDRYYKLTKKDKIANYDVHNATQKTKERGTLASVASFLASRSTTLALTIILLIKNL